MPGVIYRRGQGRWTYQPSLAVTDPLDVLDLLGRTERYALLDSGEQPEP
jgi:hypothetical protein